MTDKPFSPENHGARAPLYFEDLALGRRFEIPSRTMTEGLFAAFQAASGDNHPSHYDIEYCRRHGHPNLLAHGYQIVIQAAPGAGDFPFVIGEAMMGFLEQSSRFLKPVHAGDTLYPTLTVSDLAAQNTTGVVTLDVTIHNQHGVLVMDGMQKFLLRLRDPKD
jgi:acyl dehydratase